MLHRLPFVLVAYLVAAGAECTVAASDSAQRPNIILCMADDQGWGDVGYYGHPVIKTPHLDAMAAAGLRFDRFYAAAPVCSPTRGSVLTGRHPNRFACFSWGHTLRPQEVTVAEVLREAGYATGHFGKWHLGSVRQGSPVNPGASGFDRWLSAPNFFDNDPILSREGVAVPLEGESSEVTVDAAIEFIREQASAGRPFLAVVWFGSPHLPHVAATEDYALYAEHGDKLAHFYGEITGIDRAVGKLRDALRTLGIRDKTLFWYTSDNGGLRNLGATGGREHKGSIYEGGLRVPAIIEWPAVITEPRATDVPASTVDIYPTVLEIVGAQAHEQPPLDGLSLVPLIDAKWPRRPQPLGFWSYPEPGIRTPSHEWMTELLEAQAAGDPIGDRARLRLDAGEITKQYPDDTFPGHSAWLDWPWKLHRIEKRAPGDSSETDRSGAVRIELYNLKLDPEEANEVGDSHPEKVGTMLAQLEAWLSSVVRSLNGHDYHPNAAP